MSPGVSGFDEGPTRSPNKYLRNSREMNLRSSDSFTRKQVVKNNDYSGNLFQQMFLSPKKSNRLEKKRRKRRHKKIVDEILYDRFIPSRKESKLHVAYDKGGQDSNDEENKAQVDQQLKVHNLFK